MIININELDCKTGRDLIHQLEDKLNTECPVKKYSVHEYDKPTSRQERIRMHKQKLDLETGVEVENVIIIENEGFRYYRRGRLEISLYMSCFDPATTMTRGSFRFNDDVIDDIYYQLNGEWTRYRQWRGITHEKPEIEIDGLLEAIQ